MVTVSSPVRHSALTLKLCHAYLIALCLRVAMLCGFVVVIIGRARSGKTLILDRTTPGKVICKLRDILNSPIAMQPTLSSSEMPNGYFSIDEVALYEPNSLKNTIQNLSKRTFALSLQTETDLKKFGLDQLLSNRRRFILTLK